MTPDQVIVGAGNDYLLMLLRHILGEGRRVAMENPFYLRAARIFKSSAMNSVPSGWTVTEMLPGLGSLLQARTWSMPCLPISFRLGCIMP